MEYRPIDEQWLTDRNNKEWCIIPIPKGTGGLLVTPNPEMLKMHIEKYGVTPLLIPLNDEREAFGVLPENAPYISAVPYNDLIGNETDQEKQAEFHASIRDKFL